jgi:hypothetical protein
MAKQLRTRQALKAHLQRLLKYADHHSPHLMPLLERLEERVWKFADPGTIETRDGTMRRGRLVWFSSRGRRYAFTYNPKAKTIRLRERGRGGKHVDELTGQESRSYLDRCFRELPPA